MAEVSREQLVRRVEANLAGSEFRLLLTQNSRGDWSWLLENTRNGDCVATGFHLESLAALAGLQAAESVET